MKTMTTGWYLLMGFYGDAVSQTYFKYSSSLISCYWKKKKKKYTNICSQYARLICRSSFSIHGKWLFPCRSGGWRVEGAFHSLPVASHSLLWLSAGISLGKGHKFLFPHVTGGGIHQDQLTNQQELAVPQDNPWQASHPTNTAKMCCSQTRSGTAWGWT